MSYITDRQNSGTKKQLAQARLAAGAASVYSPPANTETEITSIHICNTSGSSKEFTIYVDDDGTTYDATTVIFSTIALPANTTIEITAPIYMNNSSGNLAFFASVLNTVTVTIFGVEYDLS